MTKYPIPNTVLPLFNTEHKKMANTLLRAVKESISKRHSRMICYALRKAAYREVDRHLAWTVEEELECAIQDALSLCVTYAEWLKKYYPAYTNNTEVLVEGRLQWIDNMLGKLNDI